jgi:protein phosphatase-4 regulatory subunit 3
MPDKEEESYFDGDDDDDELASPLGGFHQRPPQRPPSPSVPVSLSLKRKRRPAVGAATKGYRSPLRTPSLNALMDYGEDESEDTATYSSSPLISPPSLSTSPSLLPSVLPTTADGLSSSPKAHLHPGGQKTKTRTRTTCWRLSPARGHGLKHQHLA